MELSIFIAKIIAVAYLSIGVGFLFSGKYYRNAIPKLISDPGYMLLGGMISLVLGFFVVQTHNIWAGDWTVVVTIFGWMALIKGVMLLAFPKSFDFFKPLFASGKLNKIMVPLVFIIGCFFAYYGFFA
jgi:hypothetical protein